MLELLLISVYRQFEDYNTLGRISSTKRFFFFLNSHFYDLLKKTVKYSAKMKTQAYNLL